MVCQWEGCDKGAHTEQGLEFCKSHGGGPRCKLEGCDKGAHSRYGGYCKPHNFKICRAMWCTKHALGKTGFCFAHGGGKKCQIPGCERREYKGDKGGFCVAHGGGRLCAKMGCSKSAQGVLAWCSSHSPLMPEGSERELKSRDGELKAVVGEEAAEAVTAMLWLLKEAQATITKG